MGKIRNAQQSHQVPWILFRVLFLQSRDYVKYVRLFSILLPWYFRQLILRLRNLLVRSRQNILTYLSQCLIVERCSLCWQESFYWRQHVEEDLDFVVGFPPRENLEWA